jgi:hypothetical protein
MTADWLICVVITVASLSFPFIGENKLYNFMEKSVVGIVTGHTLVMGVTALQTTGLSRLARGQYVVLLPMALGLLFAFRLGEKQQFLAQYPSCLIFGVGVGLGVRTVVRTEILKQIGASASLALGSPANLLIVFIVFCVLTMHLFTDKASKWLGPASAPFRTIGRYAVMYCLGSIWASTTFDRLNSLSTMIIKKIMEVVVR